MNDLIMIVEDDPYISHFLQMSFEQEGYRILMTTKGHEALSLFYSHQPDIVILDLGLPDIDGLEVIQEIRKISSKPIIVVSARLEEQEKIKALDLGANDYVVKPFYMGELLARIRVAKRLSKKEDEEIKKYQKDYLEVDFISRKVLIDQEEIHYFFENEIMSSFAPMYSNALGGIKLKIHPNDFEKVQELLDNLNNNLTIV